MTRQARGTALVALSGLSFGAMPVLAVRAYAAGVSVPTLLFLRFLIASIVLWALAATTGALRRPSRGELIATVTLGAGLYVAQSSLYFAAVGRIAPALAVLLFYLYPALIAAWTAARSRRHPGVVLLVALACTFGGVALAGGRPEALGDPVGAAFAVAAAVTYAVYVILGGRVSAGMPSLQVSAMVTAAAAVTFGAWRAVGGMLPAGPADAFPPRGAWPEILALGVVCGAVAIATFLAGIPLVGPTRAAVLSTLEPAVGVAGAALVLGGHLSLLQWVGVMLVLAGAAISALASGPTETTADVPVSAVAGQDRSVTGQDRSVTGQDRSVVGQDRP